MNAECTADEAPEGPIRPGVPVRLSARIWRVTCGNRGLMTGPGTNTYLVGAGDQWAVIDPGPVDAAHLAVLLASAPGPIRTVLVTHTHPDHSPLAMALGAATGAQLLGRRSGHGSTQDTTFAPRRELADGDRLIVGDATLRVIHTPGHASNHLCYLLEQERLLFTGDHVIQGSTVVIDPPDGDMAAYLASLERLLDEPLECLAPGHGALIPEPRAALTALIRHRRAREAKTLMAVRTGPADLRSLLARVYDDVPAHLHRLAERSLLAHLLKLEQEGRARRAGDLWSGSAS